MEKHKLISVDFKNIYLQKKKFKTWVDDGMHASGSYDFRNLARNGKNGGNCGSMAHLSRTIHKDINIPINI